MTRAKEAYNKMMNEIFKYDNNPTYELAGITIENMFNKQIRIEMTLEGLIEYKGKNHNNLSIYQIRQ
jgi:hypothetical protein